MFLAALAVAAPRSNHQRGGEPQEHRRLLCFRVEPVTFAGGAAGGVAPSHASRGELAFST